MAVTGRPLSGKNAKVRINSTVLYAASWDVEPETNWHDTSNFEGGGFEEQVAGLSRCEGTIEGWWNGAANMHDAPLLLKDGNTITGLTCYLNDIGSAAWVFAFASVIGVPMSVRVNERINYRFRFKADGEFVYPAGAVAATVGSHA